MDFNDSYTNSFNNADGGFLAADDQPAQVITKRVTKPISVGMLSWCKHFSSTGDNMDSEGGDSNRFSDAPIKYEDMEITNVVFSGFVKGMSIEEGFNTYRIDDSTGTFDVRRYKGDANGISNDGGFDEEDENNFLNDGQDEESKKLESIDNAFKEKELVRASGAVKMSGRNVILNYLNIKKIDSYNEHLNHLLEAAQQYAISKNLLNEYGQRNSSGDSSTAKNENKLFLDSSQPVHERITHFMRTVKNQYTDGEGIPKRVIMEHLSLDREAFESAVDHLANQGNVYETSSDHLELTI
ncbi:hypothetical protein QEN19_004078 [Hanseniaspora menglaensis]